MGQLLPFHPNKKVSQREVGAGSGSANARKCASPTAPNRDGAGRSNHLSVLKRALQAWRRILLEPLGTREMYIPLESPVADAVVFSDGAFPEVRPWMPEEDTLPRMGWVVFLKTFDEL